MAARAWFTPTVNSAMVLASFSATVAPARNPSAFSFTAVVPPAMNESVESSVTLPPAPTDHWVASASCASASESSIVTPPQPKPPVAHSPKSGVVQPT